jgi:hypothetical protein
MYDAELQSTLTQIQMERSASSHSLMSMGGSRSSSLRSLGSIGNLGSLGELPSPELVSTRSNTHFLLTDRTAHP